MLWDDPRTFAEVMAAENQTTHPMSLNIVLDLTGLSNQELIVRVRSIANAGLAAGTPFPALAAQFTDLLTAADALEGKENSIALAKAALAAAVVTRDDAIPPVFTAMDQLVVELKQMPLLTEAMLAAILLRVKDESASRPAPVRPEGVALAYGGEAGKIKAMCHSQRGIADYYQARWTTTDPTLPATTWTIYPTPSSRATFSLTGLPSGQMVWVQIRAGNTTAESTWSDPACIRVP